MGRQFIQREGGTVTPVEPPLDVILVINYESVT